MKHVCGCNRQQDPSGAALLYMQAGGLQMDKEAVVSLMHRSSLAPNLCYSRHCTCHIAQPSQALHLLYCTGFTCPSSLSIRLGISVVQHAACFYAPYLIAHDACNLQDTTNVTNYQDTNITLQSIPQPIRIYDIRDMRNMMSDISDIYTGLSSVRRRLQGPCAHCTE